jgi:hypothetical protein
MGTTKDTTKSVDKRDKGQLERECFHIVRDLIDGKATLPDGISVITPHAVGRMVKEKLGLDKAPSTGAVAANFARWDEYGVINAGTKPHHIKSFTAAFVKAGGSSGVAIDTLDEFKAKHRAKLKAAKPAAEKPAKKAAAKKAPAAKKASAKKATGARKPKADA